LKITNNYYWRCDALRKGVAWLFPIAVGIILLAVGVTLMYLLPAYITSALNETGVFDETLITTAQSKVQTVQGIAMVVIIIGLIWIVIGVVGGARKGR